MFKLAAVIIFICKERHVGTTDIWLTGQTIENLHSKSMSHN